MVSQPTASAVTPDTWLSTTDVADLIKVPANTVKFWRYRGTGPRYSRVGNYVRYRMSDVAAWMDKQAQGGTA